MESILKVILGSFLLIYCSCSAKNKTEVPNLNGKQFNGDTINLHKLAKDKVTVVNVWAIFCNPCLKELPMLHDLYDRYKTDPGFAFVTIAMNTDSELAQFTTSTDTTNPYRRAFLLSSLKELRLPTIAGLSKGFIIEKSKNEIFQAHLEPSKEFDTWRQALGFGPVPFTLIYDKRGKTSYMTNYKGDLENNLRSYKDSLQHKIDELLSN